MSDGGVESGYEARAQKYLAEIAQRLRDAGLEVETEIPWGEVAPVIVNYVESDDKTLLIMASHGRTGLTKLAFGSVAENVLQKARSTPTLVCRCPVQAT